MPYRRLGRSLRWHALDEQPPVRGSGLVPSWASPVPTFVLNMACTSRRRRRTSGPGDRAVQSLLLAATAANTMVASVALWPDPASSMTTATPDALVSRRARPRWRSDVGARSRSAGDPRSGPVGGAAQGRDHVVIRSAPGSGGHRLDEDCDSTSSVRRSSRRTAASARRSSSRRADAPHRIVLRGRVCRVRGREPGDDGLDPARVDLPQDRSEPRSGTAGPGHRWLRRPVAAAEEGRRRRGRRHGRKARRLHGFALLYAAARCPRSSMSDVAPPCSHRPRPAMKPCRSSACRPFPAAPRRRPSPPPARQPASESRPARPPTRRPGPACALPTAARRRRGSVAPRKIVSRPDTTRHGLDHRSRAPARAARHGG